MADVKTEKKFASLETVKKINNDVDSLKEDIAYQVDFLRTNDNAYNMIDTSKLTSGYMWCDKNKVQSSMYAITNFIPVKPNTQYVCWSFNTPGDHYSSSPRFIKEFSDCNVPIDGYKEQTFNFITSENTKYIVLTLHANCSNAVMIESDITLENPFSNDVDRYIPYKGYTAPLVVKATSIKGKIDIKNTSGIAETGRNLYNKDNAVDGYVNEYGVIVSGAYKTSEYIPVKAGDVFTSNFPLRFARVFNKIKIVTESYENIETFSAKTDGFIRISVSNLNHESEMLVIGTNIDKYEPYKLELNKSIHLGDTQRNETGNVLYGKKWAVCGDSFSAGDFTNAILQNNIITTGRYVNKPKVYGYIIGNRNDMDIQFLSAGGRTMATPSNSNFTNCFSNKIYKTIDSDVDYITLYFGINDEHHSNAEPGTDGENVSGIIPLGTIDDYTKDTFYGAYQVVLDYLIENYPFAHIGIIVTNGTVNSYRLATIEIAKKYGIPYIDLNGDDRTPCMIRSCNQDISLSIRNKRTEKFAVNYSAGNLHPSSLAHEYESTFIEQFLKSL